MTRHSNDSPFSVESCCQQRQVSKCPKCPSVCGGLLQRRRDGAIYRSRALFILFIRLWPVLARFYALHAGISAVPSLEWFGPKRTWYSNKRVGAQTQTTLPGNLPGYRVQTGRCLLPSSHAFDSLVPFSHAFIGALGAVPSLEWFGPLPTANRAASKDGTRDGTPITYR